VKHADRPLRRRPPVVRTPGQRWGIAIVAALPPLLVALALPLVVEGSLVGLLYAPMVILVTGMTVGFGRWIGLATAGALTVLGALVNPGGSEAPVWLGALLTSVLLLGTWLAQVLAEGRWAVAAALPGLALVIGVLVTGVSGSLESGVLAAFTALSISLLLILLGPWNGDDAVRPARWAEVLAVATIVVASMATYVVSVNGAGGVGTPFRVNLLGTTDDDLLTDAGPPDPFLIATSWQLEPDQRDLLTVQTSPEAPLNRPIWATFSTYNGIAWIEPPTYGVSGESVPAEPDVEIDREIPGTTNIDIELAFPGQWVPVPQRVEQVLSAVATRVDPVSGNVSAVSSPVDQRFNVRYQVPVATQGELDDAAAGVRPGLDPAVAMPAPLTGPMADLATAVADEAGDSTWDRLTLLSQALREDRYSEAPQTVLGGLDRSYAGLNRVLAEGVGFQEQYAAIWALIARSWGVPTRLAIGWPLDEKAVPTADDSRVVTTGMTSIWAEARLEGLGWVSFQPSPRDRDAGRPAVVRPLTPQQVADLPVPAPADPSAGDGSDVPDQAQQESAAQITVAGRAIPWPLAVLAVLVLAVIVWIAYVTLRRRRIRNWLQRGNGRRPGGPQRESLWGAWTWMRLILTEAWMPLSLSYAPAVDAPAPPDLPDDVAWNVVTLARLIGPSLYGPGPISDSVIAEAWRSAGNVEAAVRKATGWRTTLRRLLVPLDPTNLAAPVIVAPESLVEGAAAGAAAEAPGAFPDAR